MDTIGLDLHQHERQRYILAGEATMRDLQEPLALLGAANASPRLARTNQ